MRKDFAPHGERISLHGDPMVIIRPEGDWDHPGILERSAERGDAPMLVRQKISAVAAPIARNPGHRT